MSLTPDQERFVFVIALSPIDGMKKKRINSFLPRPLEALTLSGDFRSTVITNGYSKASHYSVAVIK